MSRSLGEPLMSDRTLSWVSNNHQDLSKKCQEGHPLEKFKKPFGEIY
jgi:hypothetical protein